jgi:taurine dioxygenase
MEDAKMGDRANRATDIRVRPIGGALAADILGVDMAKPLDPAARRAVHEAWMQHLVLRFRHQTVTDEQLMSFSRIFGELDRAPTGTRETEGRIGDYVTVISNVVENGKPIGGLGNLESKWHTDMSYNDVPPNGSLLYALEVPPSGGDTGFCNMYLAYDALPAGLKRRIEGLTCKHDAAHTSVGDLRRGFEDINDPRETPGAVHPLVRVHPVTGRKALFLGRRLYAYIPGLSLDDSEALLDELFEHATQERFCWYQQWQVGDAVLWDNRAVMHRRDGFDNAARRVMHRTQLVGERPY